MFKMPKVKVGDINIYYEVHGIGETLVIITGASSNLEWWFRHIPVFSAYYKIVIFDPRGAGRTDAPDIPYTIEMMANDLAGLLDFVSIKSSHLYGVSMGGMIAQEFALHYPERVRRLILACTSCGGAHSVPTTDPKVLDAFQNPKVLSPEESAMQQIRGGTSQEFIDKNPGFIGQFIEKFIEHPITPQGLIRQGGALMSFDTYDRLPQIKAPTLVIHGNTDRLVPVENARILVSRIPNSELVILEKMGHLFIYEAFDESNRIILNFLRKHRH
jgi:pimeloyl-ACP methyl ester carboxylesterase